MTRREFTLALVHKACLLVRRSGSQRHLIMAIARGTALHRGEKVRLLITCACLYVCRDEDASDATFMPSLPDVSISICVYFLQCAKCSFLHPPSPLPAFLISPFIFLFFPLLSCLFLLLLFFLTAFCFFFLSGYPLYDHNYIKQAEHRSRYIAIAKLSQNLEHGKK